MIVAGGHVHTHNVEFRNTEEDYEISTDLRPAVTVAEAARDSFMGYRRENGRVGTRNYIGILTSVNCSATAARMIASAFGPEEMARYPNVDGVVAFVHGTGCGMAGQGEGFEALQRVMWGYARNPNHGGVLMVGLGCEMNQIDWLLEAYGLKQGPLFKTMNIQDSMGLAKTVETGIAMVREMLPEVNKATRESCPASELWSPCNVEDLTPCQASRQTLLLGMPVTCWWRRVALAFSLKHLKSMVRNIF